jgi:hypothetical protein
MNKKKLIALAASAVMVVSLSTAMTATANAADWGGKNCYQEGQVKAINGATNTCVNISVRGTGEPKGYFP